VLTKQEQIEYWIKTAEHDLPTVDSLFNTGHYDWCLFIGHLVIEKILKAHFVNTNDAVPPKIYDLVILAKKSRLDLANEQWDLLERINSFNMEARYPEDKFNFYKICTKDYCTEHYTKIKDIYQWLKSKLT